MPVRIDEKYCKGCNICVWICPKKVFEVSDKTNKEGIAVPKVISENCIKCGLCELYCPEFAIDIEEGKIEVPPEKTNVLAGSERPPEKQVMEPQQKTLFLQGNEAIAEGAILAGCRFYAGYPITPSSEVMEYIAKRLPEVGGKFVQTEDEIAAMGAVIGASWSGLKSMTATSGPGFSLMQENIGYATMTETPCVIVNVQRSGPSTGQATKPAQGDVMQARFGSHGDYETIALSPNSVQECLDLTVRAFNLSEKYRVPVILLTDGEIGHIRENAKIPEKIEIVNRRQPKPDDKNFFGESDEIVAPMPRFGNGYFVHVTGSTHKEDGIRDVTTREVHERMIEWLCDKIKRNADEIITFEERWTEDAEILVISYGATSRIATAAALEARKNGIKAGIFRSITIWPSPEKRLRQIIDGGKIKKVMLVEMALRGYLPEIERIVGNRCEVIHYPKIGGELHTVREVYEKIKELAG